MVFEQGGLAAAGRADQHQKAAALDREIDALQHLGGAEALDHPVDLEKGHLGLPQPLTAPAIRPRTK